MRCRELQRATKPRIVHLGCAIQSHAHREDLLENLSWSDRRCTSR